MRSDGHLGREVPDPQGATGEHPFDELDLGPALYHNPCRKQAKKGGLVMEKLQLPVEEGHIYRCPVEGCHCEISIERPPQSVPPTQPFVDRRGHEMVKVSVDEAYGWGAGGERS
jgi:hypothetical protein